MCRGEVPAREIARLLRPPVWLRLRRMAPGAAFIANYNAEAAVTVKRRCATSR
jgi:hypothetical protein